MEPKALISIGDYIVIQKQKYFKLHQLNSRCDVILGKDKVDLTAIVGQPFWTTFKMVPKKKREFCLEVAMKVENLSEFVMKEVSSGIDNRHITDDGKSQLLSTEEIVAFRDSGLSAQNIVGKLIESSTTFRNKTEYSQEKYLKKKEKKYFEYILIRKPTIRLLAEIFYSRDQFSVLGLRHDSIAQILSYTNIQCNGTYVLFESGTQALLGAAILDCLTEGGKLINITTGKFPPKQAILGMNFSAEKLNSFLSVKLSDFFKSLQEVKAAGAGNSVLEEITDNQEVDDYLEEKIEQCDGGGSEEVSTKDGNIQISKCDDSARTTNNTFKNGNQTKSEECLKGSSEDSLQSSSSGLKKRKQEDADGGGGAVKRLKWMETLEKVVNLFHTNKADGLIFACKEFPLNILLKLLDYLKPSRQLVVYSVYREPLVQLYVELKKTRKDVVGLHIYENWLRSHQVLTDRTHPDVTMSSSGGHILVGTRVCISRTS